MNFADNPFLFYTVTLAVAYLFGSIPTGLLLSKVMGTVDLRTIGSGNIGATNALRTGNKKLALLTLIGDAVKGVLAILFAAYVNNHYAGGAYPHAPLLAGFAAMAGHIFPVWLKFKGGKGVATALGILLTLHWPTGVGCFITWLVVARLSRYSSLAAIIAAFNAPLFAYAYGGDVYGVPFGILSIIIFITHRANIQRLLKGEESTIQLKKTA